MFEGLVAELLTRYLGKYIKTLNTENLKIGIWSGDVTLENLELKKRALENFNNLPFSVKEGFLGKLSIKIPWNNLKTEPVIFIIDKLYIVATPKSQDEWDEEDEEVKQVKKLDKLQLYESLKEEKNATTTSSSTTTTTSTTTTATAAGKDDTASPSSSSSVSSTSVNNDGSSLSSSVSSSSSTSASLPTSTSSSSTAEQQQQHASFMESLRNKIVDNIQISIYNVHIRFEDTITNPTKPPYCFGLTLEHLKAQSTNEDWKPTFLHTPHKLVHKLITLQNLSVYWDTNAASELLQSCNINELVSKMSGLIHSKATGNPIHNYLLHPVCGSLKLFINKSIIPNKLIPSYTFNFEFDEINLELESNQYAGIMALVEWFSILKKGERYRKFKPKTGLKTSKDRWKYALTCISDDTKDRLSKWTRSFIEKRRKDRLDYISLYKLKKRKKVLSEQNKKRLENLEKEYRFEDLVYFRSLADAEMKGEESVIINSNVKDKVTGSPSIPNSPQPHQPKDQQQKEQHHTVQQQDQQLKKKSSSGGGWFGWLGWGGENNKSNDVDNQGNLFENLEFTDEQKRELFATIDYDEHQVTKNIVYPKDYVKTRMNFSMTKGSIALRLAPNGSPSSSPSSNNNNNCKKDDVVIVLSNVVIKVDKFVESLYFQTILETIHVEDRFTENTVYPILMGPLKSSLVGLGNSNSHIRIQNSASSDNVNSSSGAVSIHNDDSSIIEATDETTSTLSEYQDTETQPLFEMWVQENPLNSDANYSVFIETLPLEVVYSKSILDSVLEFFGNAPSNTLKDIEEAARNQIKIFKDKTTLRIQYELQNHKTVDLDININAPHILVPESFTDADAPILVLDLGSFSLNSSNKPSIAVDYYNDDDMEEINLNQPQQVNDNESVPKYLYDLYELQLKNIQFFIISNKQSLPLVNRFDINFSIYKCIIQSQTLLTKLKLYGDLPSLDIQLSQQTIEMLIKILDSIAPNEMPPITNSPQIDNNNNNSSNESQQQQQPEQLVKEEEDDDEQSNLPNIPTNKSTDSTTTFTHRTEEEIQLELINTIEQLELNPQDQVPILMVYNTIFEISFSVPNVTLNIIENGKPFIKLFLSDIGAQVHKRTYDLSILLSLKHLYIEDLYQEFKDPSFKYLANSSPPHSAGNDQEFKSSGEEHLITISISAIQKNSPQYNGISQQIDINFNTLLFNCNKKIVLKLLKLIHSIENTIKETITKSNKQIESNAVGKETSFKADKNNPKIVISIKMKSLNLHLNEDNEAYFAFEIKSLQLNFDIDIESSLMRFKLGNLLVSDISRDASKDLGPLFGTDGEHIVEIYVLSYADNTQDTTISVRMSSVKLIIIRSLVDRLVDYFDDFDQVLNNNKMSTISESAKDAVGRIHQNHQRSRVLFEVDVNTPRIIFPKNLVSPYVIVADLGHISLFNSYSSSLEDPSIQSEEIYIYASSINFQSCKYQSSKIVDQSIEKLSNQVNLYICIETFVQTPNTDSPKQKVLGEISPIAIKITDQQYSLMISIIKSLVEPNLKKKKKKIRTYQRLEKYNLDTQPASSDIKDQISFRLPHISLEIFRKNRESVVCFEIDQLDFSMIDYLHYNEYTTLSMRSIELIDTRKSSNNHFKKLLYHSKEHKQKELTIYLCEQRNGCQEMKITLDHLRANIVPESIIAIIDFIMPGIIALSSLSEVESPVLSPLLLPSEKHEEVLLMEERSAVRTMLEESHTDDIKEPQLTIHIEATKIEVCLMENPTRPDSRALIGKGSVLGKVSIMKSKLTYTDMNFYLDKFEVFKCRLDQVESTTISIIDPLSITATIGQIEGNDNSSLPFDIIVSGNPIHVTFSFQDLHLCMACYENVIILAQSLLSILPKKKNQAMRVSGSNVNNNNSSLSGSASSVSTLGVPPNNSAKSVVKPHINFQLPSASVTVIDDGKGYNGVIDLKLTNISMEIIDNKVFLAMFLAANYFNNSNSNWEPLIENWAFKLCFQNLLENNITHNKIILTTSRQLNLNLSTALFDVLFTSWTTFKGLTNGSVLSTLPTNKPFKTTGCLFVLRNDTGLPLNWSIRSKESKSLLPMSTKTIETGEEEAFTLEEPSKKFRDATSISTYSLNLKLPGWKQISHLPIDRSGIHFFDLVSSTSFEEEQHRDVGNDEDDDDHQFPYEHHQQIAYEIIIGPRFRTLVVRSNYLLVNDTNSDMKYMWPTRDNIHAIGAKQSSSLAIINGQLPSLPKFEFWDLKLRRPSEEIEFNKGPSIRLIQFPPGHYFLVQIDTHHFNNNQANNSNNNNDDDSSAADQEMDMIQHNNHIIKITSPLIIENALATPISCRLQYQKSSNIVDEINIESGKSINVHTLNTEAIIMMRVKIDQHEWSNLFQVNLSTKNSIDGQSITLLDSEKNKLSIKLEYHLILETVVLCLYADFWMINRTGLPLLCNNNSSSTEGSPQQQYQLIPSSTNNSSHIDIRKDPKSWYDANAPVPPPLMFSSIKYVHNQSFTLKIDNSDISRQIPLNSNKPSDINVTKFQNNRRISLQFCSSVSNSKEFFRTKQITISPKYILINKLPFSLYYSQRDSEMYRDFCIEQGVTVPFHFIDLDQPQQLYVRVSPTNNWSSAFHITKSTMFHLRLNKTKQTQGSNNSSLESDDNLYIPLIQIIAEKGYFFIIFNPESKECPPFRIENLTTTPITITQAESNAIHQVESGQTIRYTWDNPGSEEKIEVRIPNTKYFKSLRLDKLYDTNNPVSIRLNSGYIAKIKATVYANGPTNVLRLIDLNQAISEDLESNQISSMNEQLPTTLISFSAEIDGITISVIDGEPKELMFITLKDIILLFNNTIEFEQNIKFSIGSLKVDNQLNYTMYPEMISRYEHGSKSDSNNNNNSNQPNMISATFSRSTKYEYKSEEKTTIDYIKILEFEVQPVKVQIDEILIFHLYTLLSSIEFFKDSPKQLTNGFIPIPETVDSKRLYFELLSLPSLQIRFSYCSSEYSSAMIGSVGSALANIDNASLYLEPWQLEHQFTTLDGLALQLLSHYKWEFGKIILYSDIFGAPMSLTNSLRRGVNDMIKESSSILDLARGTGNLWKSSIFGIFNTASKITGSIGNVISPISMDKNYMEMRKKKMRQNPPTFSQGLLSLGWGLGNGIRGLVSQPLAGIRENGLEGLVVGVVKGTLGAVVKTGVGVIDLVHQSSQGLRNSYRNAADESSPALRSRPPRYIGQDRILRPYNLERSFWQEILCTLKYSPSNSNEYYQAHLDYFDKDKKINHLLISNKYLYLLDHSFISDWSVRIENLHVKISDDHEIILEDQKNQHFYIIEHLSNDQGVDISMTLFTELNDILKGLL